MCGREGDLGNPLRDVLWFQVGLPHKFSLTQERCPSGERAGIVMGFERWMFRAWAGQQVSEQRRRQGCGVRRHRVLEGSEERSWVLRSRVGPGSRDRMRVSERGKCGDPQLDVWISSVFRCPLEGPSTYHPRHGLPRRHNPFLEHSPNVPIQAPPPMEAPQNY